MTRDEERAHYRDLLGRILQDGPGGTLANLAGSLARLPHVRQDMTEEAYNELKRFDEEHKSRA